MNESAIATPGVYVNEISVLPPSVAQVATAVPAFIGYTEKAVDEKGIPLVGIVPTKIFNLKEYEQQFGKGVNETGITVDVVLTTTPSVTVSATAKITTPSVHNMYYAVRLYFHPLVRCIWIGALVMFLGGAISLSDRRLRVGAPRRASRAPSGVPAE